MAKKKDKDYDKIFKEYLSDITKLMAEKERLELKIQFRRKTAMRALDRSAYSSSKGKKPPC